MLNIIIIAVGVLLGQLTLMIAVFAFFMSRPGLKLYGKMIKSMEEKMVDLL